MTIRELLRNFPQKTEHKPLDIAGRLDQKKSDVATVLVDYDYTPSGQRARMRDNMATAQRETRYVYDARNRLRIKNTPEGTLTYGYDDATGNLLSISARLGYTFPGALPYDFSTINATAATTHGTGASMTYAYDERRRLTTVNADGPGLNDPADAKYSYNSVGSQANMRYRNGVETAYAYNQRNQLTQMAATHSGAVASFQYHDDTWPSARQLTAAGLRQALVESISGAPRWVGYSYDNLNRLTRESLFSTGAWTSESGYVQYNDTPGYDPVGNHHKRTVSNFPGVSAATTIPYNVNDRLDNDTTASTPSTHFDANGNTLKPDLNGDGVVDSTETAYTYGYDLENRLTSVNDGAGMTITMVYDGDGNRVKKTVTSGATITTAYLVDDRNPTGYAQVLEERDGSDNTLVSYVYGLDLVSQTRNTGTVGSPVWTTHYYGYDGLGSVRYLANAAGTVTDTYTYDAFGIQLASSGRAR